VRVFFYLEDRERTFDSPTDKLLMSVTAFADELEREKARQRTYDAMQRKARAGHVTGGRVFGYDNVEVLGPDGQRSHVERRINEDEAAVVRRIFALCADGDGLTPITKTLNEAGCPAPVATGTAARLDREHPLATLRDDIMRPSVIEEAIRLTLAEFAPSRRCAGRRRLETELAIVRGECERLADAIARGGPIDVLLERLQARQSRRVVLEGELAALRASDVQAPPGSQTAHRLRVKLADWRGLLMRNVTEGRAVLRTLLMGPIRFKPIVEERRRGYAFEGLIALDRLVAGSVDLPRVVRPQRDSRSFAAICPGMVSFERLD